MHLPPPEPWPRLPALAWLSVLPWSARQELALKECTRHVYVNCKQFFIPCAARALACVAAAASQALLPLQTPLCIGAVAACCGQPCRFAMNAWQRIAPRQVGGMLGLQPTDSTEPALVISAVLNYSMVLATSAMMTPLLNEDQYWHDDACPFSERVGLDEQKHDIPSFNVELMAAHLLAEPPQSGIASDSGSLRKGGIVPDRLPVSKPILRFLHSVLCLGTWGHAILICKRRIPLSNTEPGR